MKHTLQRTLGFVIAAALMGAAILVPQPVAAETSAMKFGMDVGAIGPMTSWGAKPDYATLWVGVWTQKSGWGGVDTQLTRMRDEGVTPVIHFYYWGNDISRHCLENGCWSSIHNSWKDKTGWQRLAQALVDHLHSRLQGREAVIILETEFNKNDVANYEPLDGYLSQKAGFFQGAYPGAQVALGFGNWGSANWGMFDRAAGTSKYVGIQAMRASTRDSVSSYTGVVGSLLGSVKTLSGKFDRPVFITDIALSSHWEPQWLSHQASTIKSFMDRRGEFKAAGAVAMMYRGLYDAPNANTNEYYGEGERHFGLAWAWNKTWKPSLRHWMDGIKAERGGHTASTSSSDLTASFHVPPRNVNEWWVQVTVKGNEPISGVTAAVNGGAPVALKKQYWGDWARSFHVPRGSSVVFRATSTTGDVETSKPVSWLTWDQFSVSFTPKAVGNDWWVEVYAKSPSPITKMEASVNNGPYIALEKTSWGTWAKSIHAVNGVPVKFRATSSDGATATSDSYTWW